MENRSRGRLFPVILICIAAIPAACSSQPGLLGTCEGCEAVFEYDREQITLAKTDTLTGFNTGSAGPGLILTGTVYEHNEENPAEGVILYIHQTNEEGVYPTRGDEQGWARRHGYLRGWIQTEADGKYTFYTTRPGTYPDRSEPAHIHITVLEPDGSYYWIEDFQFEGDPLLTEEERASVSERGGSNGIINPRVVDGIPVAERNIILGKNIPGYENR